MRKHFRHLFYTSLALSITTLAVHAESIDPVGAASSMLTDSVRSSGDVTLTGLHEIANIGAETPLMSVNASREASALLNSASGKVLSISANSNSNSADRAVAEASADVNDASDPATITIANTSSPADTIDNAGGIAFAADAPATDVSSDPTIFNVNTATSAPEPSTFWFVGSLVLGAAVMSRKQMSRKEMGRLSFSR